MKDQLILVDIDMYFGYINAFIQEESNTILGRGIKIESPKDEFNFREWADDNDLDYEMYGDDELIDSSWGYTYYIPFDLYIKYLNENREKFNSGGQIKSSKDENGNWSGTYRDATYTLYHLTNDFSLAKYWSYTYKMYSPIMEQEEIYFSDGDDDLPPLDTKKQTLVELKRSIDNRIEEYESINKKRKADILKKGGQTDAQKEKISYVMDEFKSGNLKTSYGTKVTDNKQAIAIALSEAGVDKKEDGGVIEGQLHSECNDDTGCGEKFNVSNSGRIIEAERDEAVIVSNSFNDNQIYIIYGSPSQIASALNVMGGGKNFDDGAEIQYPDGSKVFTSAIKNETNDSDVGQIDSGSVIINRRSMYDNTRYRVKGTPKQIASAINSVNGNGVIIDEGAEIKKA